MVEDYVKENNSGEKKTYAPVSFGSRLFTSTQLKFSVYYKEFLALYFALDHFANYIWGNTKPVIILTDNRSLTQFLQAKSMPPSLWNFLDRVLAFNIVIAHIPGKANYAAEFFSRMQTDPEAQFSLRLTEKVPVREIEIESEAETPDVSLNTIEEIIDAFKEEDEIDLAMVEKLKELGMYETYLQKQKAEPEVLKTRDLIKLKRSLRGISAETLPDPADFLADIDERIEQLDIKKKNKIKIKISEKKQWLQTGEIEDLRYANSKLKKYYNQLDRLVIENDILCRKIFDDDGTVKHKQLCVPQKFWKELVYRIHNSKTAGHSGISRTAQEFRKRFYFPGFTEYLIEAIKNCLTCMQLKRTNEQHQRPNLQPVSSEQSFPGDMMQIDLIGPLQSPIYKYALTGIDVFSKYLFDVPLTNASADTVARELVKIFFNHSYIPTTIV